MFAREYLDDLTQRTFVATSFSPNEARKVFPCFDEPRFKATFDIIIQHPLESYALSNAQQISKTTITGTGSGSYIETAFSQTPKISSYLVGWLIVPDLFTYVETTTTNGVPVLTYLR